MTGGMESFSIDLTRLASSLQDLISFKKELETNSTEFEELISKIKENWSSDVGTDLADLENGLNDCVSCLNGLVIPVLGDIINIMTALGNGTKDIASASIN